MDFSPFNIAAEFFMGGADNDRIEGNIEALMHIALFGDPQNSMKAAYTLKKLGKSAVSPLIRALQDNNINTRWKVAMVLGIVGEPAVEELIRAVNTDFEIEKLHLLWVLASIRDERALETFVSYLENEDSNIRYIALEGLRRIGSSRVLVYLDAMRNDENDYVRSAAIKAFSEVSTRL
jgi:HEAT repeat protein